MHIIIVHLPLKMLTLNIMTLQSIIILQGARAFETSRMINVKYVYVIYVYTLKSRSRLSKEKLFKNCVLIQYLLYNSICILQYYHAYTFKDCVLKFNFDFASFYL